MKYNKQWKLLMETDDVCSNVTNQATILLSYDMWKKRIKNPSSHFKLNWRWYLNNECTTIDNALFSTIELPMWLQVAMGTCCNKRPLTSKEIIRISEVNKTTLYKICKKLDKLLLPSLKQSGAAMEWYIKVVSQHKYKFLGGAELARIRIDMGLDKSECPICLDDKVNNDDVLILSCGHIICTACALCHWPVAKASSNSNISPVSWKRHWRKCNASCPLCRISLAAA